MGKIAEALKANLKEIAQSDARALREIDNELRKASAPIHPNDALNGRGQLDLLLGRVSFEKQTVSTLKKLCRENKIKGYSKLKKPELCKELKKNGIDPPPPPLESFSKKALIQIIKQLTS